MANIGTLHQSPAPVAGGLHLRLCSELAEIELIWRYLEQHGVATVYQSFDWCSTWCSTLSQARKASPVVIAAEDVFGRAQFILPLQLRKVRGIRIIEALTAPQCTYGFGLFDKDFYNSCATTWFSENLHRLQSLLPPHDVFRLADMPESVGGLRNPLLGERHFRSANQSYAMELEPDFEQLLVKKRSAETRRGSRKRDAKLAGEGRLEFGLPLPGEATVRTLDAMFADQQTRLAETGVHNVYDADERAFIQALSLVETTQGRLLRPYTLTLDGKILSVMLGAYYGKTYWALISSLAEGAMRKHSPGDYALRAMFKSLCEDGTERLDFAAGDTAYKLHWADTCVPLYFVVRSNTLKGLAAGLLMVLRERTKRVAKNSPFLAPALFKLRKVFWGRTR